MIVKELIAYLSAFDENQRIEIFDSAYGCIDITDVFSNEHHKSIVLSQRLTHYRKTYTKDIRRAQAKVGAFYPYLCSARARSARAVKRNCEQIVNYLFPNCKCFMNGSHPIIHILFTKSS